jgi:hypothetical protein
MHRAGRDHHRLQCPAQDLRVIADERARRLQEWTLRSW